MPRVRWFSHWLLTMEARFCSRVIHVEYRVGRVVLGQVFL